MLPRRTSSSRRYAATSGPMSPNASRAIAASSCGRRRYPQSELRLWMAWIRWIYVCILLFPCVRHFPRLPRLNIQSMKIPGGFHKTYARGNILTAGRHLRLNRNFQSKVQLRKSICQYQSNEWSACIFPTSENHVSISSHEQSIEWLLRRGPQETWAKI